jgi:hypothetical protein
MSDNSDAGFICAQVDKRAPEEYLTTSKALWHRNLNRTLRISYRRNFNESNSVCRVNGVAVSARRARDRLSRAKAFASVSDFRIQCEKGMAHWHNYQPPHTLTVDLNVGLTGN